MRERADKLNNHAIILASDGEHTEAIACFKRAILIERNNYLLWYNLGITYRDSGDMENARSSLEKAHQIAPEKQDVLETLSTLAFRWKNTKILFCIQKRDSKTGRQIRHSGTLAE